MTRKLVVVGAGPVGCLAAIALAKMGWSVEIYEARPGTFLFHHRPYFSQRKINARYALTFFTGGRPAAID